MTARGQTDYVAVPAFVSRVFRHSGIYIRTDRGIKGPEDLKGKTIGVPEYQITANVWIRGILQDEYGVHPNQVHWRRGGVEQPGREERAPLDLPGDIDLKQIADTETLSSMLESGQLDAVFSAKAPSCVTRGAPNVGLLFPNFREAEQAYFKRSQIFPIMHVVGIRRALVEQHPWLPVSVFKAFVQAKQLAMEELAQIGHLYASLPWGVSEYHASRALMGDDFWSYGLQANRHVLDTFTRYHHEQGLSDRQVAPEELFSATTLNLSKN
jgi:4,5-dihydroxyphthalate decarboxylase